MSSFCHFSCQDFFEQHCRCGAAKLAFQDNQKRHSRSEFLSSNGILPDLSTIPEVSRHSLVSKRRGNYYEYFTEMKEIECPFVHLARTLLENRFLISISLFFPG